jgi:16S rRNA (adenine1518-N6/adenine1519-N6)-dimethyltransferase
MVQSSIFEIMTDRASVSQKDTVLDIGAGVGFLTRFLASRCRAVIAVEVDADLANILHEQLTGVNNSKIIEGDILKAEVPLFNKVVSTPPYQISSSLILWLFNRDFDCAVLVLQKEFANRLTATVGCEDYGWLTVLTYYYSEADLLDDVPRSMFHPQPKIDSIIVRLRPRRTRPFFLRNEMQFRRLLQSLFTQRNRKVRSATLPYLRGVLGLSRESAAGIAGALPFSDRRVRELAPEDFGALANAIIK